MIYRVFREYFMHDKHVGVFETEADALAAAESEAAEFLAGSCVAVVTEEAFGRYPECRELHRIAGSY